MNNERRKKLMKIIAPQHIAITMDGNGRWGKERGKTRSEGHYAGAQTMEHIIEASRDLGIKILTLYAFSSENWKRPLEEVNYLMFLPIKFFKQKLPIFMKKNIRIMISGDLTKVPKRTRNAITKAIEKTKHNTGIIVNFAFNYGGRDEILQAMRRVIQEVRENKVHPEQIDEELVQQFLYTSELPDPDLFIRTGGEKRLSNFLLWQAADAELYFTDQYFPDFTKDFLLEAIYEWQRRKNIDQYDVLRNTV
ncbi:isoprenyl transferase [Ornithinibacillus sp. 4-3]|uniref:Isoprenyl transferase n=1 Tax=Ornithinibacillus sp. 4-3 TaxID=3231488 RepID=A0AB39HLT3_9BACI